MAIKWYLTPNQASWGKYWEGKSLLEMSEAARNNDSITKDIFTRYVTPNTVFFEGGCGLGQWPVYVKDQGGQRVIGLDSYAEPLKILHEYRSEIEVIHGSVESIPLEDESVDFYLSGGVIEHFEEGPGLCLSEAHRILKKGGILLVTVPYQNIYRSTLRRFFVIPLLKLIKPGFRNRNRQFYQYYYTRRDMRRFLAAAQFTILDVFYIDEFGSSNRHMGIYLELPFLRKKGGKDWELIWTGQWLARLTNRLSKAIFCSGIGFVVKKS